MSSSSSVSGDEGPDAAMLNAEEPNLKVGAAVVVDLRLVTDANDLCIKCTGIERKTDPQDLGWRSGVVKAVARDGDDGLIRSLSVDLGAHASYAIDASGGGGGGGAAGAGAAMIRGPARAWRFDDDEAGTLALKFAAHAVKEWYYLAPPNGGARVPLPFSPEDALVIGREHASAADAPFVSRAHARLFRNGDKGAYPATRTGQHGLDDTWTLQFVGQNVGAFHRTVKAAPPAATPSKNARASARAAAGAAIRGYCYKLAPCSGLALLGVGINHWYSLGYLQTPLPPSNRTRFP